MAKTVIAAFDEFLMNSVNLDGNRTKKARRSRDWLIEQILTFPIHESDFPTIYKEKNIFFGSFARNIKKRPLDDIDIMIALSAQGCKYSEYPTKIEINVPDNSTQFKKLCNYNTVILNSKKLINLFINNLKNISQYDNAEIKRNQEAATLKLLSYEWNFDIVPCFFTAVDSFNKTYYIIPDGYGDWKKTDPRLDKERVQKLNNIHDGHLLNVIRIIKYWNKRLTMPTMGSYLLENLILDYYSEQTSKASKYVDTELLNIFYDIHTRIRNPVSDYKEIQENLNNLSLEEKNKISERAYNDYVKAFNARESEKEREYEKSIKLWKEIFGDEFPSYG